MSVQACQRVAKSFHADCAKGVATHNMASSGRERDLFRWLKLPFDGYTCELPLKNTAKPGGLDKPNEVWETVNVVLPSDILFEIHMRSLEKECLNEFDFDLADFWRRAGDDFFFQSFEEGHPWNRTCLGRWCTVISILYRDFYSKVFCACALVERNHIWRGTRC